MFDKIQMILMIMSYSQGAIVLRFCIFSMFLYQQGWSHHSYQLILQKRRHENMNHVHFQNVVILFTTKVVCSLTSVLFFAVTASHEINQTFFVTVKTVVYLKILACDSTSKSISFCNIFTHFLTFTATFVTTNCSADRM